MSGALPFDLPVGADGALGIAIGLGLAAAAGLRVFVPLVALAIAGKAGVLTLSPGFAWLATTPALIALGTACALEIGGYYIPWVDHLLDVVATPAALIAGMVATASVVTDLPPMVKWAVVLIGGGAAGLTQGASVLTRLKSTATTGGVANPLVATVELVGAVATSALAILVPIVAIVVCIVACVWAFRRAGRLLFGRLRRAPLPPPASA
ncbi:MAG: DUF4126 domain-containing protein [Gemmatimonadaceae bacterium]|nr:DUF4126 domain-containing protein [Gemmatimonadaceae bacterium]